MKNPNESIVLVGGGGGVYRVARFLKHCRPNITTIQTTFDHGGHSGSLRDERGVLPPGDIRQAILALSDDNTEPVLRSLLAYRFSHQAKSALNGATVGNILLTALAEITGSLPAAIKVLCGWYGVTGKVLPVSLDSSELCVKLSDGSTVSGEGNIDTRGIDDDRHIVSAYLEPEAHIYTEARQALLNADKIVFCPGDLFTSLVPNFLVQGFAQCVQESKAQKIYILNLMTKKSETHSFRASKFVQTVLGYLGIGRLEAVIGNDRPFSPSVLEAYEKEQSYPVILDELHLYVDQIVLADVAEESGGIVRHSSEIARKIASL